MRETGIKPIVIEEKLLEDGVSYGYSADIKGANNYGIKTCWFDKELKGLENSADYTVNYLLDIKGIIKKNKGG